MSELSFFWPDNSVGDSDPISAAEFRQIAYSIWGYGADDDNTGVIAGVANELKVQAQSPVSGQVDILIGAALVRGGAYINTATMSLSFSANASGSTRYDIVVLEEDYNAATGQTIRLVVIEGTPGAGLPALTHTDGTLWHNALAYVELANGYTTIANSDITDLRSYANLPARVIQEITNSNASALEYGTLVVRDTGTGGRAVDTTTTENDPDVWGIIESRTLGSGGAGRVVQFGVVEVICDEAVVAGDTLVASTTAGEAQANDQPMVRPFGVVLTANSGAGTRALAFVNFLPDHSILEEERRRYTGTSQVINSSSKTKCTTITSSDDPYSEFNAGNSDWTLREGTYIVEVDFTLTPGGFNRGVDIVTDLPQTKRLFDAGTSTEPNRIRLSTIIEVNGTETMEVQASGGTFTANEVQIVRVR